MYSAGDGSCAYTRAFTLNFSCSPDVVPRDILVYTQRFFGSSSQGHSFSFSGGGGSSGRLRSSLPAPSSARQTANASGTSASRARIRLSVIAFLLPTCYRHLSFVVCSSLKYLLLVSHYVSVG